MRKLLGKLAVTGGGTGYLPIAPGTWGSAAVCGIALAAIAVFDGDVWPVAAVLLGVGLLSSIGCVALGRFAETTFGKKDPGQCTVDEWAGQAVALLLLPLGATWADRLVAVGAGFVCFRVMDIVKPPPARRLEKLPYGWGVLIDDLVAGVYANLAAQVFLRWAYLRQWG